MPINNNQFVFTYLCWRCLISKKFAAKRESRTVAVAADAAVAAAIVERALALSTLDRGTVKLNKTAIKVRAKQKTRTAHTHTLARLHSRTRSRRWVGVSVGVGVGGCSFLSVVFIYFLLALGFSVFFARGSRMCENIFLFF